MRYEHVAEAMKVSPVARPAVDPSVAIGRLTDAKLVEALKHVTKSADALDAEKREKIASLKGKVAGAVYHRLSYDKYLTDHQLAVEIYGDTAAQQKRGNIRRALANLAKMELARRGRAIASNLALVLH